MKLNPATFIVGVPVVVAIVVFPPLGIVAGLGVGTFVLIKWLLAGQRRTARAAHRRHMDAYYHQRQVRIQDESAPTTNPGWRL